MKTRINEAIESINQQIDYINNNPDYLDPFYDFLGDAITENDQEFKEYLSDLIEENTNYIINDSFITYLIEQVIDYDETYFKLVRTNGFSVEKDQVTSFSTPEQELLIFNDSSKLSPMAVRYVEDKTDTIISDGRYAYISLHEAIAVIFRKNQLLSQIDEVIADYNESECKLLVDDQCGVCSLQMLPSDFDIGLSEDDIEKLLDRESAFYYDDLNVIENTHQFRHNRKTWRICQMEGGIYAVSENYIFSEV